MNHLYYHPARESLPLAGFCSTGPAIGPLRSYTVADGTIRLVFMDEEVARAWIHRLGERVVNVQGHTMVIPEGLACAMWEYHHVKLVRRPVDALQHNQQLDPDVYNLQKLLDLED